MSRILFTVAFFLISLSNLFAAQMAVVLKTKDASLNQIKIAKCMITSNGSQILSTSTKNGKLSFKLDYDKKYKIQVSSNGFETYNMLIDANIIDEMKKYEYEYILSILMVPSRDGYKAVYKNCKGITQVGYNKSKDEFNLTCEPGNYSYKPAKTNSDKPKEQQIASNKQENNSEQQVVKEPITKTSEPLTDDDQKKIEPSASAKQSIFKKDLDKMLNEIETRNSTAKQKRIELDQIKQESFEIDLISRKNMAKKRRSLIEEIADSKKTSKKSLLLQN